MLKKISIGVIILIGLTWAFLTGYLITWRMQEQDKIVNTVFQQCQVKAQTEFENYNKSIIEGYKLNGFIGLNIDGQEVKLRQVIE